MNTRHPGRPPRSTPWPICKIDGCDKSTEGSALGFCHAHYAASRRGQLDPTTGKSLRPAMRVPSYGPGARCSVPNCGSRPKGRGLCVKHYQQWEAGIDLGVEVPDRGHEKTTASYSQTACCCFPGCLKRPVNRWMCNKHALQRQVGIIDEHGAQLRDLMANGRKRERERWVGSSRDGYIVRVAPEGHPHARADGTIAEHRLVMEQKLGRYLEEWELVHHKNGNRADNRPENLELLDGRAKRSGGPGHDFDLGAAVQTIMQQNEHIPDAVADYLQNLLHKENN